MREIITFDQPTRFIMHFASDEGVMPRVVYYQCEINPDSNVYSPSGDFVRFNAGDSEVHGWIPVSEVVVDELLEVEINGEWQIVKEHKNAQAG